VKDNILNLIANSYRLEPDRTRWLDTIATLASRLTPGGAGVMIYVFDARTASEGVAVPHWAAHEVPDTFVEGTLTLNRSTSAPEARRFYQRGILCGTVSEELQKIGGSIENNRAYSESVASRGFPDTFGLTASGPSYQGLVINSPLPAPVSLSVQEKRVWRRIGVHLQAAFRLRELNPAPLEEAVIEPGGRIVHAEGAAKPRSARLNLTEAVRRLDWIRNQSGHEEFAGLDVWEGLVDGRWSLVQRSESDGKRHIVAVVNEYGLSDPRALTQRERAVVALAAQGDSNKWIGYQLGISEATASKHLGAALSKLQVKDRTELVWIYQQLRS
jgi:DNA-binding CsgD family transcriptional regulator